MAPRNAVSFSEFFLTLAFWKQQANKQPKKNNLSTKRMKKRHIIRRSVSASRSRRQQLRTIAPHCMRMYIQFAQMTIRSNELIFLKSIMGQSAVETLSFLVRNIQEKIRHSIFDSMTSRIWSSLFLGFFPLFHLHGTIHVDSMCAAGAWSRTLFFFFCGLFCFACQEAGDCVHRQRTV